MKIRQFGDSGEADKREMIQLARECQAETLHVIDLPYRLSSWALDEPENASLWVDEAGRLVAWAVMQTPFWTIDYVIKPEGEELHQQLLVWAEQRARILAGTRYGLPAWFVNVYVDQVRRRQTLEAAGFTDQAEAGEDAWSKVWMERDGQAEIPEYPIPNGFGLRVLAGEGEVGTYVALHQETFETKNMTNTWRTRTLQHPDYKPELDVVAVAPDGRLGAFCIGWISQGMDGRLVGQIEPLGCHADYRSFALGKLALCESMRRLQRLGAESMYVETDNYRDTAFRLYESVGFRMTREVRVYRKDYFPS